MIILFFMLFKRFAKLAVSLAVAGVIYHAVTGQHRVVPEGRNWAAPVASNQVQWKACYRIGVLPNAPCWIAYKKGLK